jgi:hemerythrin-like domain-containing protein
MASVHNMVLRGLNSISLQAPHIKPQDRKSFLQYSMCFYDLLYVHHKGEEEYLFPEIERMSSEDGIMDGNIEQHHSFHRGLSEYNKYIKTCLNCIEEYAGIKLVSIIDSFGNQRRNHLEEEITTILDLVQFGDRMKEFDDKFTSWLNKDTVSLSWGSTERHG